MIGLQKVAPVKQVQQIPDITPMRRGRPTAPVQAPPAARPSPSPMRGTTSDPFAALDSQDVQVRRAAADELAARFPSLDEFSLLHDRGQKFEFGQAASSPDPALNKRVTEALADDAFAQLSTAKVDSAPTSKPSSAVPSAGVSRSTSIKHSRSHEGTDGLRSANPTTIQPNPQHAGMVSTGVQTSPRSSPAPPQQKFPDVNSRPIWKVPQSSNHSRTVSQPRTPDMPQGSPSLKPEITLPKRPSLDSRSRSHLSSLNTPRSPASSRPSLEGQRPSASDLGFSLDRSRSVNSNARPVSIHVESDLDFLRDRELASGRALDAPSMRRTTSTGSQPEPGEKNVRSSIDFLRSIEKDDYGNKLQLRRSNSQSKQAKRESLTNLVKGRFSDAFRRFEQNTSKTSSQDADQPPLTPTDRHIDSRSKIIQLTPIAGSEATGGLSDDDRSAIDETQDLSPEMRRELEKRRLEEEERRVEAAAAEYRKRLADKGAGKPVPPSKASTIQNRVKNLLDESNKPVAPSRTAEGYGKYTDTGKPLPTRPQDQSGMRQPPAIARKPIHVGSAQAPQDVAYNKSSSIRPNMVPINPSASAPPTANARQATGPPPRAPKPKTLQTGNSGSFTSSSPVKPSPIAKDKPLPPIANESSTAAGDDWDVDTFSKRYPSLSGLEMVETEIPQFPPV